MDIVIAPISGGFFCNQIAMGCVLAKHGYNPSILMGASGGAVAISILTAANFEYNKILYTASACTSEMFAKPWDPLIPSWLVGFFQGSIYNHSTKHNDILSQILVPDMLIDKEIWILTYNINHMKACTFCSTTKKKALLNVYAKHDSLINSVMDPVYLNGDLNSFGDAVLGSASIPTVVPAMHINGSYHIDGGIYFASGLIPLSESIKAMDSFHIVYLHGKNITTTSICNDLSNSQAFDPTYNTIFESGGYAAASIIRSHIISDHRCLQDILTFKAAGTNIISKDISLEKYFATRDQWQCSVLELYTVTDAIVNVVSFTSEELIGKIKSQIPLVRAHVSYFDKKHPE